MLWLINVRMGFHVATVNFDLLKVMNKTGLVLESLFWGTESSS